MHAIATKLRATGIAEMAPKVVGVRDCSRPTGESPASMLEYLLVARVSHLSAETSLYFRDRVSERDESRKSDTENKENGRGAWVEKKNKRDCCPGLVQVDAPKQMDEKTERESKRDSL